MQSGDNTRIALTDIIKGGKEHMKEMNIPLHRKNKKAMRDCHDTFLRNAFEKLVDKAESCDTVDANEIQIHMTRNVSNFLVTFNRLKLTRTQPSNFINRFHQISNIH